jgi:hypothetical protein
MERFETLLDRWGPVPRTLVTAFISQQNERTYEAMVNESVVAAVKAPDATIRAMLNLDNAVNPGSSKIFFIKPLREQGTILRSVHTVYVHTPWLVNKLAQELSREQAVKNVEFFHVLSAYSKTRSAAGWIFEEIIHEFLVRTKSIDAHWYGDESPCTLELSLDGLDTRTTTTELKSSPPFYWRPGNPTDPGIDGAIITLDHVYLIRATISREHSSPQEGVDSLWHSMPQDKKTLKWKLLFIGPVADQTEAVSAKHARCLEVGDKLTRAAVGRGGILRDHLPVGRLSFSPYIFDVMRSVSNLCISS